MSPNASERILILAPTGRDAQLASMALSESGLAAFACTDIDDLCARIEEGAGVVMITEEALTAPAMRCLGAVLSKQPPWADLPLLIFASQPSAELVVRSFEQFGERANVTMIERPIRVKTMTSAITAALRARRRQYQVRDLFAELEQRVAERDQFLAMLSHELRNPLAALTLAATALDGEGELTNERAVIVRQTRHLGKLVDDLLDIARVTSGKIALSRTNVDVADVVEHCTEAIRPRAAARHLTLQVHLHAPHATVRGDAVRLEQVVNNLLANAVKYTPPGGSIDVFLEHDHNDAVLRVVDSGKGIAPEMLTRIFDMFTQGDVTIDRSEGGMGIGLTLVRRLVQLHGGEVRAYSRGKGSGSEFVVRIPRIGAEQAQAQRKVEDHSRTSAQKQSENGKQPRRTIVVVEDNPDIRDLLRIRLKHLGHRIDAAPDGTSGLDLILHKRPEIALVDIGLPGLDGYGIARRVREELGSDIYLIALTGYGQADDKKQALDAGFNVHLTKPADFVDLQNVIARIPQRTAQS
ncbi:MAG TPA: ATP-binding protein, partial [Thermoanaerobaculia bacterium]|nr:ATP-binding protein [Thermoanaerobaculia bacterium]